MLFDKLARLTEKLDDRLRLHDFAAHRTVGGRLDHRFRIARHTPAVVLLPSLLSGALVLGAPTGWLRPLLAVVAAAAMCGWLVWALALSDRRKWPLRRDLFIQLLSIIAVGGAVWVWGSDQYRPTGIYRHVLMPFSAALAIALLAAALLISFMFRRLQANSNFNACLRDTELFADRGPVPAVTWGTVSTSLLMVLFRAPLELLTLPAIAVLLASAGWVQVYGCIVLGMCFVALFVAGLNERFDTMWTLTQVVFFQGGALIVSVAIIVLAALRLTGVLYVTTILDSAAGQVIAFAVADFYVLSWYYDYWSHRLIADQVIGLFDRGAVGTASISYPIDPNRVATSVPARGRVLQVHGSSRFIVIREGGPVTFFQSYAITDLLDTLAASGAPGGRAVPTPMQVRGRMFNFHTLVGVLFVGIITVGALRISKGPQEPEVTLRRSTTAGVSLSRLLFAPSPDDSDRPAILIAASGGGTRAALYAASVLEGIANLGHVADVRLGSGVSGGGAALAYFAARRPELIQNNQEAWQRYFDTLKQPFIRDVLEQASEWRMVRGGRLGTLLAQSFRDRWHLEPPRTTLTDIDDFGLILNTSLAGHFERPKDAPRNQRLADVEPRNRATSSSDLAGGRLVFTNLQLSELFAGRSLEPGGLHSLPVVIRSPDVRLEDAAALNANFPPVFPNAAVDVDDTTRFWVTDGGAADNRGMEMLLYALRDALQGPDAARRTGKLPRIHVVVADASAFSEGYVQDRGVSTIAGAGTRFASQLAVELVASIRSLYQGQEDRFQFSYLLMPERLRASDSFGTHWMLQDSITIRHDQESRTLKGDEMIGVLRALYTPGDHHDLAPDACRVLLWGRSDPAYRPWLDVVTALGGRNEPPTCSPEKK